MTRIRRSLVAAAAAVVVGGHAEAQFLEVQKVHASDGAPSDGFAVSASLSGDRALLGAFLDDDHGSGSGSAYVMERQPSGAWVQAAKLVASDGAADDSFGWAASLSGDRALVGAYKDDDHGPTSGSAYVFERQAGGAWVQKQKLVASDGAATDSFGFAVALAGDHAIVGSGGDDDLGSASGSAYVFERQSNGAWVQKQKLLASDGAAGDAFGHSVAVSGDRALVGAIDGDGVAPDSGAAYVFERQPSGSWVEVAKLTASDGGSGEWFGRFVSVSGDVAFVGAPFAQGVAGTIGAAYVFERQPSGVWIERQRLTADLANGDLFGWSVSVSGARGVVGAYQHDHGVSNAGAAHVFERKVNGAWVQVHEVLASDRQASDWFGASVSIEGNRLLVGANGDDDAGSGAGAAYVLQAPTCALNLGYQGPQGIELSICGDDLTTVGSAATFLLEHAPTSSFVLLFAGLTSNPTPIPGAGGTLVPIPVLPSFPIAVPTDAFGIATFPVVGGANTTVTVYLQVVAPTEPSIGFSNAIRLTLGL